MLSKPNFENTSIINTQNKKAKSYERLLTTGKPLYWPSPLLRVTFSLQRIAMRWAKTLHPYFIRCGLRNMDSERSLKRER